MYPLFPGKNQAQTYLNELERRGCTVSERPDDCLLVELPSGISYLAPGFSTLDADAWHVICDAADAVGLELGLPVVLEAQEADEDLMVDVLP